LAGAAIFLLILAPGMAFLPGVALGMGNSSCWRSYQYIASGRADEFRRHMEMQTAILKDENIREVFLPVIDNRQGPREISAVTQDPNNWNNVQIRDYYKKDSVVGIGLDEWNTLYGPTYGEWGIYGGPYLPE